MIKLRRPATSGKPGALAEMPEFVIFNLAVRGETSSIIEAKPVKLD